MAGIGRAIIASASGMPLDEAIKKYGSGLVGGTARAIGSGTQAKRQKKEKRLHEKYLRKIYGESGKE